MAMTLSSDARNAAVNAVVDLLDVGGAGNLVFLTAGDTPIATCPLNNPAFGAAAAGSAALDVDPAVEDTNCDAGTMTKFQAKNNAGTAVFSGTVTATGGGGDITAPSTTLGSGDMVRMSSLTYTQPAS